MPRTNPNPDAIDEFLKATYNANKHRWMTECAEGSLLDFSKKIEVRLKRFNAHWSWRKGYSGDLSGDKYSSGLSGRKAIQVGLGYEWGDDPASAYVMTALAFCGFWNPKTQKAAVVVELLREIFKLKTANLENLLSAIKENSDDILGQVENPIWLHILALQEIYDFDDTDLVSNTALSVSRLDAMEDGKLLKDWELSSLVQYLNGLVKATEANYSVEGFKKYQLRDSNPAEFPAV